MKISRTLTRLVIIAVLVLTVGTAGADEWRQVKSGKRAGISGIAPIRSDEAGGSFLIVHDNKKAKDKKLAVLEVRGKQRPRYSSVSWPKNAASPVDLESITSVPGKEKGAFLCATSKGEVFHIQLAPGNKKVEVLKQFKFPDCGGKNFEGLRLYEKNGLLFAVWAHRGGGGSPAVIFWGSLDLSKYEFSSVGSASIRAPWPTGNDVRSISDLEIDENGLVYISAASDPGDNGPFDSALYRIGKIVVRGQQASLRLQSRPEEIHRLPGHKVEGVALLAGPGFAHPGSAHPGSAQGYAEARGYVEARGYAGASKSAAFVVGTDDENKGSSIRVLR